MIYLNQVLITYIFKNIIEYRSKRIIIDNTL